ncbi:hypothetical protein BJY59DRAFT_259274 [Rhodotorula toruloides]
MRRHSRRLAFLYRPALRWICLFHQVNTRCAGPCLGCRHIYAEGNPRFRGLSSGCRIGRQPLATYSVFSVVGEASSFSYIGAVAPRSSALNSCTCGLTWTAPAHPGLARRGSFAQISQSTLASTCTTGSVSLTRDSKSADLGFSAAGASIFARAAKSLPLYAARRQEFAPR